MSENLQKLIGVAVMAVLIVVGVVVSSGDDMDYTRNLTVGVNPGSDVKDVDTLILVALTDIAETLEGLVEDEERRGIERREQDAGGFGIESFADMITLLCVGDSTALEEQKIMRTLDLAGAYLLHELSADDRWWLQTFEVEQKFRSCVKGWMLGLHPEKAGQLATHFGWKWNYEPLDGGWIFSDVCSPDVRRPLWGKEGSMAPFGHQTLSFVIGEADLGKSDQTIPIVTAVRGGAGLWDECLED